MQDSQEDRPNGWWDIFLLKMKIYLSIYLIGDKWLAEQMIKWFRSEE